MSAVTTKALLGGRSAAAFLRRHWQREALLVRAAVPGFAGLHTRAQLFALACRDDIESRLVLRERGKWSLEDGPFRPADLRGLPPRHWTLLVQGVNVADAATDALMRAFAFVPYARLDDVMVSYAAPGGGVGPHVDSYDVFLLQGRGRRRWRWGRQRDLMLRPNLPLKILRRFTPGADAVLGPGDMLYLPPQYAHDGVAVDACTTYSIGFRAPAHEELAQHFLDYLRDRVALPGRYADAGLRPTRTPARIDAAMVRQMRRTLAAIRWTPRDVAAFAGTYLSEPEAAVTFDRPAKPLSRAAFAAAIGRHGVALDRGTQFLYDSDAFYVNGETLRRPAAPVAVAALRALANRRTLSAADCRRLSAPLRDLLHRWHEHGYIVVD